MAIFQQLNERGITVIMVTHESDIAAYAKRNVMMRDGLILDDHLVTETKIRLARFYESKRSRSQSPVF
jgi:putative ABC transport system ATP-binding protein